jgi:aspartyl-tRNA(Asn)/glutamyl-tRNA(Gln) amidotransferase subunit A
MPLIVRKLVLMATLQTLGAALRARQVSSRELVEDALRQIERLDRDLNAFITVTGDAALAEATLRDEELRNGFDRGPLHGIPIAHKDLIRTKGVRTTGGSRIYSDYVPRQDAAIVRRLHAAGAISVGKTGLHELAYGLTSNNPHFGAIHNPYDLARIPGGSSGGSAAAVAAGIVVFATGTDTGGSIRVPASFCGVVGLKPTFGRVSVRGVLPLGFSQDHVGPMTRTVRDAAIAFQCMASDPTGFVPPPGVNLNGLRIGWPRNYFFERLDPEVDSAVRAAFRSAVEMEAQIVEIDVPDMESLRAAASTCLLVEAAAELRPYLDRRADFGADVLALLDQGKVIPGIDYIEARRTRVRIGREFERLFAEVDCIFTPTTAITAPKIGETTVKVGRTSEEVRAASTRLTRGMNALGNPAISIPCGMSKRGMPIGLQIIAARGQDDLALHVAAAMEDALA